MKDSGFSDYFNLSKKLQPTNERPDLLIHYNLRLRQQSQIEIEEVKGYTRSETGKYCTLRVAIWFRYVYILRKYLTLRKMVIVWNFVFPLLRQRQMQQHYSI